MQNLLTSRIDQASLLYAFAFLFLSALYFLVQKQIKLQEANKSLARAHAQLQESVAQMLNAEKFTALGEMAGAIAHELNQPLNVTKIICQGLLNDIRKDRLSVEELKKDLPEVVIQMDRMALVIEHMRKFTAIKKNVMKEGYGINSVIESAFKLTGAQMAAHSVAVKKELAIDLPALFGDAVAIEQAILGIMINARNAVEESGKPERNIVVKTYLTQDKNNVCVEISDNGLGVSEDIRDKIFQPFFTTKNALTPDGTPAKSTGLGLSLALKTVKDHGGEIVLVNKAGEGSTFKVILPIKV